MRVLMTGGGTGGHINPALAIAKTILKEEPDSEIAFVGTSKGMENRLVPKEGFPLYHIEMQGLRRSLSFSNLKTLWLMLTSTAKAKKLIRQFKPDICIGTGGYVCWPLIKAAADMGIPTALHESNALAGVAVKLLAAKVDVIFTNFEKTAEQLRACKKIVHVGNPLKNGFSTVTREEARGRLGFEGKYRYSLLSCGGSLGAGRINTEALLLMRDFSAKHPDIHHLHQAGVGNYAAVKEEFDRLGLGQYSNLQLVDYIYDMPDRLAAADLVINRAGA
ncbi:MAG: UDP-N-acetylglucosamine--N-acetylmuramyl-(pentapeptide) pyrophosphoryl-undecaprenol N-acetylglucosamine transferase, partial [Clostridia bacterium]|nr:UDP-N-acetylglucosamine--N-acetylmuramyl-(pentapeptide) pyrophosphoryl-undecaprenol N-acetylglucosamine transferase [Clostridia bacterium]